MTAHHCTNLSVALPDAHVGHCYTCSATVYAQCICVAQASLSCSPCLLSLLHLPTPFSPGLSFPDCPLFPLPRSAFHHSLLSLVLSLIPFVFIPISIDLPLAHIGTGSPHVYICASVYVYGWRMWLEFHYLFSWPYPFSLAQATYNWGTGGVARKDKRCLHHNCKIS